MRSESVHVKKHNVFWAALDKVFWAVLATFWAVELVRALVALRRGIPDFYPRQHSSSVILSAGSLLLALSTFARDKRLRGVLLLVCFVVLLFGLFSAF
jgi:multisubunit Na+/H+ antiporter MnhG subunit